MSDAHPAPTCCLCGQVLPPEPEPGPSRPPSWRERLVGVTALVAVVFGLPALVVGGPVLLLAGLVLLLEALLG